MKKLEPKHHCRDFLHRPEFTDWEKLYLTEEFNVLPWFHPVLDSDFDRALENFKIFSGTVLDLGSGPGTQAIALAERGFTVTATDISGTAIEKARTNSGEKGLEIEFVQDDILDTRLKKKFDVVIDRGCFHILAPEKRMDYVRNVKKLMNPFGYLFLKCFSYLESTEAGPYRFTQDDLRKTFGRAFKVLYIEETRFYGPSEPHPRALFCAMRRPR